MNISQGIVFKSVVKLKVPPTPRILYSPPATIVYQVIGDSGTNYEKWKNNIIVVL